jgi:DNA-directed RNA polymerase specialized sigma subunit
LYHQLIELGSFWSVPNDSAEQDKLIDLALDAERHAYVKGTANGSPGAGSDRHDLDQGKQAQLSRYTEIGQQVANEPTRLLETQESEREELALLDADARQREERARVEAEEDAKLRRAGAAYYRQLPWKQRQVFHLICKTDLPNGVIARRCQTAPAIVSRIRTTLEGLADEYQTAAPAEIRIGTTTPEPALEIATPTTGLSHAAGELATQLADAADTPDAGTSTLNAAETLRGPEVNADELSDRTARGYQRAHESALLGSRWGHGKQWFNADALSSGRDGGGNPVSVIEKTSYATRFKLTDTQISKLERIARRQGVRIEVLFRELEEHIERKEHEAEIAAKELSMLRRQARLCIASLLKGLDEQEQAELREWADPYCRALAEGRGFDELFRAPQAEAGSRDTESHSEQALTCKS